MSQGDGSSPAGTPSIDSLRGSCEIFSNSLKSRKVSVSGSWAIRSRAVALSHSRPVRIVSPMVTRICVSPAADWLVGTVDTAWVACGPGDAAGGEVGVADTTGSIVGDSCVDVGAGVQA